METGLEKELLTTYKEFVDLRIIEQIDYTKFYMYSIITHSTAIEGSTITEIENIKLFEDGSVESGHSINEYFMNVDLKKAYDRCYELAKTKPEITESLLRELSAIVMRNTGSEYFTAVGNFSSADGDYRKLNVRAGLSGPSYMDFGKVPLKMKEFCSWLNSSRETLKRGDLLKVYELSIDAHYNLVTIHPWADGNGRMSRLLMNYIQIENDVLPIKISKRQKSQYIQALKETREADDLEIFRNAMISMHIKNMRDEIAEFTNESGMLKEPYLFFEDYKNRV